MMVLAVAKGPGATDEGEPETWVSWLELIIGVKLIGDAISGLCG
jgi:hypothetical protein